MKIFVDVTNLLSVSFLTGIQRVVIEVLSRLANDHRFEIVPFSYSFSENKFRKCGTDFITRRLMKGKSASNDPEGEVLSLDEICTGTILFDIDSVWNSTYRRSALYPVIKANGARIVVYVYDIIPITYPQFSHENIVVKFEHYIGATLKFADRIIVSTQHTIDEIARLCSELGVPEVPGSVSWLGADFRPNAIYNGKVANVAMKAAESGKFALMVGTVEPRKNHATVIDAFDDSLFAQGYNLIIAGRIGWNSSELEIRIKTHRLLGKKLFFLEGMNDASIDYLYHQATCVVFATFEEGFGLPIIEAFHRGTPVIASDIPVLREVGKDCCVYFDPRSPKDIADKFLELAENNDRYEQIKSSISSYKHVTWDEVSASIGDTLYSTESEFPYPQATNIRQIVYLTARADDLLATLPFVEHFMPFIDELVLCCPDGMEAEVRQKYHGRLKMTILTDSTLLAGDKLPKDHAMRNFFLRCRALRRDELDPVFIMSDDDYRPIVQIKPSDFYEDGTYKAYYCYQLEDWRGEESSPSSFDRSMYRTRVFLSGNGLPTRMYDSHMPQVIDRRVFCEMLDRFNGIECQGLSDWSTYFNFLTFRYASRIRQVPCATLTWPGRPNMWEMQVEPDRFLFENFYAESYDKDGIFAGMTPDFHEGIENDAPEKVSRFLNEVAAADRARTMFQAYRENYEAQYGAYPCFDIAIDGDSCRIDLPMYLALCENDVTRIRFSLHAENPSKDSFEIGYLIRDIGDERERDFRRKAFGIERDDFNILVRTGSGSLWKNIEISVTYNGKTFSRYTRLKIMSKPTIRPI